MTPEQLAVERDRLMEGGRTLEDAERAQAAMAASTVFIIKGAAGPANEYNDRPAWAVAAYLERDGALRRITLAQEEEERLYAAWVAAGYTPYDFQYDVDFGNGAREAFTVEDVEKRTAMRRNAYDPKRLRVFGVVSYYLEEVPLGSEPKKAAE